MGELADDFRFMREARQEERQRIEPERINYAVQKLMDAGHRVSRVPGDPTQLTVNGYIHFWPFTGYFAGKGIGSGRGIHKLIEKLKG